MLSCKSRSSDKSLPIFLLLWSLMILSTSACGGGYISPVEEKTPVIEPIRSETYPEADATDTSKNPADNFGTEPDEYWPTSSWREATPEQVGMDSELLAEMLEDIHVQGYRIDSVSIIRDGFLVLDAYFQPFKSGEKHIIHSCTKSIVATLIGIAISEGYIESEEEKVVDLFHDKEIDLSDSRKSEITLADLLMMGSGLKCRDSYLYQWQGLKEMSASEDWAAYVLNLPMEADPGTKFEYCNGGSYTLSAILQESSGMTSLEFAQHHLFDPLEITNVSWPITPEEINPGWGDMYLTPLDMAKIGYLYLNEGRWGGQQVVPEKWIAEATSPQITAGTLSDSYGYQWWIDNGGYYMALGYAGQYIIVVPEENLVVVFTSQLPDNHFFVPEITFNEYIQPAVISSKEIAPNPEGRTRLEAIIQEIASPD